MLDLIIIAVLSLILVPLVEYTTGAARIVLGLIFLLFSPGYSLISALFPGKGSISKFERLALSFGLSFALVSLTGLILNYTPFGIRLYPILISQLILISILLVIAWLRRRSIEPNQRFQINLKHKAAEVSGFWASETRLGKALNVVLAISAIAAITTLIYTATNPKPGEKFSEFYILGAEGIADDYPEDMVLGESAWVTVGIVNREHDVTIYNVEVFIDDDLSATLGPLELAHEDKHESRVTFAPNTPGNNQKVEFRLYKNGSSETYLDLHIWINVTNPG
ncbi:MAG: DUF1616 domain-containing protein [Dehalococcoidales bacterium]|jgi:uncharacterized membrane protein|nr:DUF1616 domain-containing protein [Dehalococcoidales bacterium]NLE90392.1 DUF1616 domain-containing protein [Dehalococcoidales bacterium]